MSTVIKFTNSFFANFDFSLLQKWKYQYKKINEKAIATKLRETILTMTNHNLHKSNLLKRRVNLNTCQLYKIQHRSTQDPCKHPKRRPLQHQSSTKNC